MVVAGALVFHKHSLFFLWLSILLHVKDWIKSLVSIFWRLQNIRCIKMLYLHIVWKLNFNGFKVILNLTWTHHMGNWNYQKCTLLGWLGVEHVKLMTWWFEFNTLLRQAFFPAYFSLPPLLKHVRKVVSGFGKISKVVLVHVLVWESQETHERHDNGHDNDLGCYSGVKPNTTNKKFNIILYGLQHAKTNITSIIDFVLQ